jgi:hypothetical protein
MQGEEIFSQDTIRDTRYRDTRYKIQDRRVLRVAVEQEARREGLPQLPSPLEKGEREAVDEENV